MNTIFVVPGSEDTVHDNAVFSELYAGADAQGIRFIDDVVAQTKVLFVPKLQLTVALEHNRLRIDDESGAEPATSRLVPESLRVYHTVVPHGRVQGFGFNFDVQYRFEATLPMRQLFGSLFVDDVLKHGDLIDLGIQFTLDHSADKRRETYFLKIVSPLELSVHANYHFQRDSVPDDKVFNELFEKTYADIDDVINQSKF